MSVNQLITFEYSGKSVEFTLDGWVNITPLGKLFGKKTNDYFKNKSTQEFLEALGENLGLEAGKLVSVFQGTFQEQGTFVHPKVAVHFAQWANPKFALWVSDKIEELLTQGQTSLTPSQPQSFGQLDAIQAMLDYMKAQALKVNAIAETQAEVIQRLDSVERRQSVASRIIVESAKDFKTVRKELLMEKRRSISSQVLKKFEYIESYRARWDEARYQYKRETGYSFPPIKNASMEELETFLEWVSKY